jgi:hypothetical protein
VHLPVSLKNDPDGQEDAPVLLQPTSDPVRRVLNGSHRDVLFVNCGLSKTEEYDILFGLCVVVSLHFFCIQILISDQYMIYNSQFVVYNSG